MSNQRDWKEAFKRETNKLTSNEISDIILNFSYKNLSKIEDLNEISKFLETYSSKLSILKLDLWNTQNNNCRQQESSSKFIFPLNEKSLPFTLTSFSLNIGSNRVYNEGARELSILL